MTGFLAVSNPTSDQVHVISRWILICVQFSTVMQELFSPFLNAMQNVSFVANMQIHGGHWVKEQLVRLQAASEPPHHDWTSAVSPAPLEEINPPASRMRPVASSWDSLCSLYLKVYFHSSSPNVPTTLLQEVTATDEQSPSE